MYGMEEVGTLDAWTSTRDSVIWHPRFGPVGVCFTHLLLAISEYFSPLDLRGLFLTETVFRQLFQGLALTFPQVWASWAFSSNSEQPITPDYYQT